MKTVEEFIAKWKIYGDDQEFISALRTFKCECDQFAYSEGYKHGLSVGTEQGILSGAPTPDDEKGFLQPNSAEQQAKVDALGEQIWNHNFGPDAKRRP